MEKLQFLGAAVAFFPGGTGMILYEVARNNANRPILNGGNAIQLYYCGYLSSFVLGTVCVVAAMGKRVSDMYVPLIILLVALPFGTAIACGALMQWAGNMISGWSSIGGLALGIYFFHKCMEVLAAA